MAQGQAVQPFILLVFGAAAISSNAGAMALTYLSFVS